jgi:hypothetical protein
MIVSTLIGRGPRVTGACIEEEAGDCVRCVHGPNEQNLHIQGRTVAWVRGNLRDVLNIAPGARAFLDGRPVGEEHVLEAGRTVEFLDPIGHKGVGRLWGNESQIKEFFDLSEAQYQHWLSLGLPVHRFPDGRVLLTETDFDEWSKGLRESPSGFHRRPTAIPPEFLSPQDAAAHLGIQSETLEHLRKTRKIRAVQIGDQRGFVYAIADLRDFAARRTIPTGEEEQRRRGRR